MDTTLFDSASEFFLGKFFIAKSQKQQKMYELAVKAIDYYREHVVQNEPYDDTTSTYSSVAKRASCLPYIKDSLVIPKQAITGWEVSDCNGITHSKVEFLDHLANYEGEDYGTN